MAWVNVDIELDEFSDAELIEELNLRGFKVVDQEILHKIYEARQLNQDVDDLLKQFVYDSIGRSW